MRSRIPVLVLVAVVLGTTLPGCGYRRAMKHAERHAEAEHWREAVVEYRIALQRKPDSIDAQLGLDAVRTPALHDALGDGRHALSRQQYEAAMEHAAFAAGLVADHAGIPRLRGEIQDAMRSALDQLIEAGAMEQAYPFADRLGALFPTAGFLHEAYDRLRSYFFDRAEDLLARQQYAEALEQLSFVDTFEPDLVDEVESRAVVVRDAWADDLVGEAAARQEAQRIGAASVLLATAHQVAGRETDLARARRLAGELRSRGTFTVEVRIEGEATGWTPAAAEMGIEAFPGARVVPDGAGAWFSWSVQPSRASCESDDEVTRAAHDYVAGQTSEDNPDYSTLLERGDILQREIDSLAVELSGARGALERTSAELGTYEAEVMRPLWEEIQAIRYRIQELEAAGVLTRKARREIEELQQRLDELLGVDEGAAEDHRALRVACDGARYQLELLVERDEDARNERDAVQDRLESTPPLLFEDVVETLHYDIHHWTRTCTAELRVTSTGRWGPGLEENRVFVSRRQTTDRSNAAHPAEGVAADPLEFTVDDDDLIAGAHAANVDLSLQALGERADGFYAYWWSEARSLREADPDRATDAMLMVYLGAPRRMGDRDRDWIADHVLRVYGLEDLEVLR
jgi:hypothetical protein